MPDPNHLATADAARCHDDYLICRDGEAFLIVNATETAAREILQGLRKASDSIYTMEN